MHLADAGGEAGVVSAHEVGCIDARVLALEVRKREVEIDLQNLRQHGRRPGNDKILTT